MAPVDVNTLSGGRPLRKKLDEQDISEAPASESPAASARRLPEPLAFALDATVRSYARVMFARSRVMGALLLAATFVAPQVGLAGLIGCALAWGLGLVMGMDREAAREGLLGYNGLLTGLVLGAAFEPSTALLLLGPVVALVVVLLHVALAGALHLHMRLPVLSLPFVLASWLALATAPQLEGVTRRVTAAMWAPAFPGPAELERFLSAFGAIFVVPGWVAGLLVLAALMSWSRIAAVHAAVGYTVARLAEATVLDLPYGLDPLTLGFNVLLTSVALGGVFYVPGRGSMLLAAGASLACVMLSVGITGGLVAMGWPAIALPFNLIVLLTLYALAQRTGQTAPRPVDLPGASPEESLHRYHTRVRRFQQSLIVRLQLPFRGEWVCTQGNDGEHTHKGAWRHGLDFEVLGADGLRHRGQGARVTEWHCYGLPVCAAAAGTVVEVVDGIADNPVGEVNTKENWGNLVIVQHAIGLYSMVAHLQPGSIKVRRGEPVVLGQELGRCGSSGRSPVPHLHFQLQSTPAVGDGTVPVAFHGVTVRHGEEIRVEAEWLPQEDEILSNPEKDEELAATLAFPPGSRLTLTTREGEASRTEVVWSEVDLYGNKSLFNPQTGARLWFDTRPEGFVVYDVEGARDSALLAMYCALSKVPLQGGALRWEDHLNRRRLQASPLAWFADLLSAVLPLPEERITFESEVQGQDHLIRGLSPQANRRLKTGAVLRRGVGLVSVHLELDDRSMEVKCVSE
ncbi:MAG: urea transporter [Alphaproteobacteria bacterium]|nr:urea transporter [Alphaproteobacteria bacterium]